MLAICWGSSHLLVVTSHSFPQEALNNMAVFYFKASRNTSHMLQICSFKKGKVLILAHLIESDPSRITVILINSKFNWYGTLIIPAQSFHLCYISWPNHQSKTHLISSSSQLKGRRLYMVRVFGGYSEFLRILLATVFT